MRGLAACNAPHSRPHHLGGATHAHRVPQTHQRAGCRVQTALSCTQLALIHAEGPAHQAWSVHYLYFLYVGYLTCPPLSLPAIPTPFRSLADLRTPNSREDDAWNKVCVEQDERSFRNTRLLQQCFDVSRLGNRKSPSCVAFGSTQHNLAKSKPSFPPFSLP